MRVISSVVCILVALAFIETAAHAQEQKGVLGVGLIVGEPTGVSAKYYLSDDHAIDAAVGFGVIGRGIQVHGDYLLHPWILETQETFVLPLYIGAGLRFQTREANGNADSHVRLGLRAVGGFLFDFTNVPLDVFVEVAGVLDYRSIDNSRFGIDVNAGAGVRYYF